MTETERLKKIGAVLATALTNTVEAESFLEEAAMLAEPTPERAEEIWKLKAELDQLGRRILEVSKS